MSDEHPAAPRPAAKRSADERRRAAMQPTPTREEVQEQHQERLETMDNPPTPTPTQEEADVMLQGAYAQEQPVSEADAAAAEERRQRDMRPEAGAEYKTR